MNQQNQAAALHIALQIGFSDDEVAVRVNGLEVLRKAGVKTRIQAGLAEAFDVDIEGGPAKIELSLPSRGIAETLEIVVTKPTYLGVSVDPEDGVRYSIQHRPFRYA